MDVSVIICTYNAAHLVGPCLESLRQQVTDCSFEVIVVDSSTDGTVARVREIYPEARILHFETRKYCGDARNAGIAAASGALIALIDADCLAAPDWIASLVRAHRTSSALAIGGSIANRASGLVAWASYFTEFSHWMPGNPKGAVADVAGANLSYKREAFAGFGPFIEGTYCSDSEFHARLRRAGQAVRFDPAIRVTHVSIARFGPFVRHEFFHGRSFGRVRRRYLGLGRAGAVVHALAAPLVVAVLLARIGGVNVRNPVYFRWFFACLPLLALGTIAWVAGETRGAFE